jgi:hypothetical protein
MGVSGAAQGGLEGGGGGSEEHVDFLNKGGAHRDCRMDPNCAPPTAFQAKNGNFILGFGLLKKRAESLSGAGSGRI